jgi:hypothetical protein
LARHAIEIFLSWRRQFIWTALPASGWVKPFLAHSSSALLKDTIATCYAAFIRVSVVYSGGCQKRIGSLATAWLNFALKQNKALRK